MRYINKETANRVVTAFLTFWLLISIIGIPINQHYCSNHFVKTTIGTLGDDPCGDMPMPDNCCQDKTTVYSISDFFSHSDFTFVGKVTPVILICNYTQCITLLPKLIISETPKIFYSPPTESKLFVAIQSFLL